MTNTSNWSINTLRFTAFPKANFQIDKDWWENVVGEAPETMVSQAKTGTLTFEGNFGNGKLVLIANLAQTRIDWVYTPPNIEEPPTQIPSIGEFSQELNRFHQAITKWLSLDTNPEYVRLALGLVLHQSIPHRKLGYEILASQYLNFSPSFDENTSDFSYQINRKRVSKLIRDLEINRLMKWSVSGIQTVIIVPVQQVLPENFAVLLELDINSTPEYKKSISSEMAKNLLDEFVELANEISQKGDIV